MSEPVPAGSYPGNPSLPVEVREKILSTFRHTLDLYRDGKIDDCLIGCDFILKMDPRFGPARKLQEKAKNPRAEIDVAELAAAVAPPSHDTGPIASPRVTAPLPLPPRDLSPPGSPGDAADLGVGPDAPGLEGLDDLSLDSLSLDGPLSGPGAPGAASESGLPFDAAGSEAFAGLSQGPLAADPGLATRSPEHEIDVLLKNGDAASAAGDRQQAIEIWSRIFLIDINNADAVARIEEARREMADESRRIAASLDKGQESFARGDLASARSEFDAVLSLGEEPAAAARPLAPAPPPSRPTTLPPHDLSEVAAPGDVLAEEMEQSGPPGGRRSWTTIPHPPRESSPEAAATVPAAKWGLPRIPPRMAIAAGAVLVAAAVAAFFLLRSSGGESPASGAASGPTLEHATQSFREGKIDETIAELRQIPREHPDYARAQKLLASLTNGKEPAARPAPAGAAAPPRAPLRGDPATLRAEAERALHEKRYIDAMKSFSLAAPHFQSDPTFARDMATASERVSELTPAVKLYNDGEYETAIPILWRIYQAARDNRDARSYLVRSYYNQGIIQLQNGLFEKAQQSFAEVLALDPDDVEAARHHQFAGRYRTGELDLLGRIYVRYISPRA